MLFKILILVLSQTLNTMLRVKTKFTYEILWFIKDNLSGLMLLLITEIINC